MPEGDTIYALAARLRPLLRGKTLTRSDFRVPRLATVDLSGWRVDDVRSIGKHLVADVSDDDRRAAVRSHLGMDGSWRTFTAGQRWNKPGHTARVILAVDGLEAVGFSLRELHLDADPDRATAHLGPDLLGPGWDPGLALANIAAAVERTPRLTVSEALLDQRLMAGIGNVYRNEICFLLGAHPASSMAGVDAEKTVALARDLLWENRLRVNRNTTGLRGRANHCVYGRGNRPCRRCGTPIRRIDGSGRDRVTYWCPACQPVTDSRSDPAPRRT
ncbi:putative DNA glycosylase [Gordonia araii NBRC 100433]|uniref:DNA-(apurinic or apyrimidinic site) lyase n=1 Tax=Gordonia araii NBRC 100433 TaxID=1073574 RepID=G7GZE3_9ACTN|nr:DNA-formamidopyrimidine glycosylase family protein [Gordonia araii]NNG98913.1 Fpg/Nei family DNA glycosylase [Gordonia araii NBRC 100433]GAB08968.1 putative DNA glycosylase [Gordonia araii NBRC 100433]